MATRRPLKTDHLIPIDICDSKSKAGVWFGEKRGWKKLQKDVMNQFKDATNWVDVKNSILVISEKPEGVVLVAPNPALPGIMVFANGTTEASTKELYRRYTQQVSAIAASRGSGSIIGEPKARAK